MPLKLDDKKEIVADVTKAANSALSVVAAHYRGLTSSEMTEFRAKARSSGVKLKVVRNTLARRAFKGTDYECLTDSLIGPVILAFADEEPGAGARLIRDFSKEHDKLEVQALALGSKLYDKSQLAVIASLPNKEEAIARLMMTIQAPITKLVRTIAAPHTKLVRTVVAIRDSKE